MCRPEIGGEGAAKALHGAKGRTLIAARAAAATRRLLPIIISGPSHTEPLDDRSQISLALSVATLASRVGGHDCQVACPVNHGRSTRITLPERTRECAGAGSRMSSRRLLP